MQNSLYSSVDILQKVFFVILHQRSNFEYQIMSEYLNSDFRVYWALCESGQQ